MDRASRVAEPGRPGPRAEGTVFAGGGDVIIKRVREGPGFLELAAETQQRMVTNQGAINDPC